MSNVNIHSVLRTLASGHVLAEYTALKGAHEGQRRIGLVSPSGRAVKSAPAIAASPAPASKPARKKTAPKPAKKTASKPAKAVESGDFVEICDPFGDGGRPGIALVESAPSVPPRNPTPRKGEAWPAFAGRCAAMGIDFKAASPLWQAHKPAKVVAVEQTARPAGKRTKRASERPTPARPSSAPVKRTDVDARTEARKARKKSQHEAATSLAATVKAQGELLAAIAAKLGA